MDGKIAVSFCYAVLATRLDYEFSAMLRGDFSSIIRALHVHNENFVEAMKGRQTFVKMLTGIIRLYYS